MMEVTRRLSRHETVSRAPVTNWAPEASDWTVATPVDESAPLTDPTNPADTAWMLQSLLSM